MASTHATQLTIYPIDFLGSRTLGADWAKLRDAVAGKLSDLASAARANDLWGDTYTFPTPATAVQAWCTAIDAVKGAFRWERTGEPLPIQFLLHGEEQDTPLGMDPRMWAFLLPEAIYVTKKAWELWQGSGATTALPPVTPRDELLTALRLSLKDRPTPPAVRLFPRRTAPLSGSGEECFYCGLRSHAPPQCPSRNLRPDVSGLALMGRLPLPNADRSYARAFHTEGNPAEQLVTESGPKEIGKSPELQALAAFFDLRRIFQPRFLEVLFLSGAETWPDTTVSRGTCGTSSSPICRGLRALLERNYAEAEHLFGDVKGTDATTKFFGEVGLALVAVEKGHRQRVRYHLERAGKSATTEAEKLYVQFLHSRLQELSDDLPGALRAMDEALERRPCDDARYRREQLAVQAGRTDGCAQRLQLLASRRPETAVALLLDPWLEPVREELDRKLLILFLTAHQGGKGKYATAKTRGTALADWLGERDPDIAPVISGLQRLGGKVSRAGYYDMLELERDAAKLSSACDQTRRSRSRTLQQHLDDVEQRWQPLQEFWKEFGLKGMYRQVGERVAQLQGDLVRARELAGEEDATACKEAMELVAGVQAGIVELAARTREIGAVPLIYNFVRRFLVYLVMMESLALTVGLAILPLFRLVLSMDRGQQASAVGGRSVLDTLTFAVAPVLALVLAGMKQKKTARSAVAAQAED